MKTDILKIGLLTPYNGANLGDGAIQYAMINNIKKRHPDAYIHGLTLDPETTSRLHDITCSPLTVLPLLNYCAPTQSEAKKVSADQNESNRFLKCTKDAIKATPFAYPLLKSLLERVRRGTMKTTYLMAEFRLLWKGYYMLKDFDMLIVSGGGQLDDYWGGCWGHPFSLFKWGLIARMARTRYVFLSVGTCTFESRISAVFLKWALKMASYRSYRDETSKMLLRQFAFTQDDPVYPDMAFSLDIPTELWISSKRKDKPVIGISPIAYFSSYYWPKKDLNVYDSYITALKLFTITLLRQGYSVKLFYTSGTDKFVAKELFESLQKGNHIKETDNMEVVMIKTVKDLIAMLGDVDIVVASRLHGVILSHLLNRPVLAISYDRKVTTYMEDVGQSEFCLDIHHSDPQLLTKTFDVLSLKQESVRNQIAEKMAEFKQSLSIQFDEILNCNG